jgi:hypothetical protein
MIPVIIISTVPNYGDDILTIQTYWSGGNDFTILASDNAGAQITSLRFNRSDVTRLRDALNTVLEEG